MPSMLNGIYIFVYSTEGIPMDTERYYHFIFTLR